MSDPVKILFVDTSPTPTRGGAQKSLLYLLTYLDRSRFEPHVFMYLPHGVEDELAELNVPYQIIDTSVAIKIKQQKSNISLSSFQLPKDRRGTWRDFAYRLRYICKYEWKRFMAIYRYAKKIDAKLIYLNGNYTTAHGAILAAKALGITVIAHQRILAVYTWIDRYFSRMIDSMVMYTGLYMQRLLDAGVNPKTCMYLYNAVPLEQLPTYNADTEAKYRQEFQLEPDIPIVVQIGNVDPIRGHDVSVRAVQKAWSKESPFYYVAVGEIRNEYYLNQLKAIYQNTEMEPYVRFVGFRKDAVDILSVSDVSIESTYMEAGFTRVVIESLALGKKLVAPALGCSEIVDDGMNGFLYENGDVESLANKLTEAIQADSHDISTNAKQTANEHFNITLMMKKFHVNLETVLAPK